jgi:Gpi18-like mannosyltransferase
MRRKFQFEKAILVAIFYLFNPATIFNTSIWGQYDSIYTFFLVLAILLIFDSKIEYSVISYTFGVLSKPQSIALAPLIAFLILKERGWKGWITSGLISAATTLLVILPFRWNNPLEFLIDIYFTGYSGYSYTSVYAFNFWAFHGFWKTDSAGFLGLDFFLVGWLIFGALTIFSLYQLSREYNKSDEGFVLFTAFVLLFGFFMLPTRIHERYLFPVFSFVALTIPYMSEMKKMYTILSITYLGNLSYVLSFLNRNEYLSNWNPIVLIISAVNVIVFLSCLNYLYRRTFFNVNLSSISSKFK